jgi:hypothetical protein
MNQIISAQYEKEFIERAQRVDQFYQEKRVKQRQRLLG